MGDNNKEVIKGLNQEVASAAEASAGTASKEPKQRKITSKMAAYEGKYLTFALGNEEYGLEILKVREINGIMDITKVPQTPAFLKGVINLRGKIIPVIDIRLKFGMPEVSYTKETCVIVVSVMHTLIGIIVDTVSEVLDIMAGQIDPPPSFGSAIRSEFILGMGKVKGQVKILLNIARILSSEEIAIIDNMKV